MMRSLYILAIALLLAACKEETRQESFTLGLKEKKAKAEALIRSKEFSTENLLTIQEYFFEFSQRVHLLKDDSETKEGIKTLLNKSGAKDFCNNFVLKESLWKSLDEYCNSGEFYLCSFEIASFQKITGQFKFLLGDASMKLNQQSGCEL